jgi:hypothetical protein
MAKKTPPIDPAESLNRKILADRQKRIIAQERAEQAQSIDLGLKIESGTPESAAEFLRDEWDKKAYGEPPKTTTRVVYGPDPIVDRCPEFHDRLEKYGKEAVAEAFHDLVMKKGELAAPDAIMRKGLRASIAKFGKEPTAKAFYDRIMQIPERVVEIELDDVIDPMIVNPMRDLVARYAPPGMSVKFLSDRCMDVIGKRGYEIVKDERGDPVRMGGMFMGIIPEYIARRREEHFVEESDSQLAEMQDAYMERAEREIHAEGGAAKSGASVLRTGERLTADPRINDEYDGDVRATGFKLDRAA